MKGTKVVVNDYLEKDYWEEEIECISDCSKAPSCLEILIYPLAKEKIEALMEEYKNIEWLAYLIGTNNEEKREITDIFVPDQEISTASVDNIKCKEFNTLSIIGVIHSHHNMGNNFSSTDNDYINQNHNISLCISKSGINGQIRWKTPCGSYKIIDCKVKLKLDSLLDKESFIKKVKEKIKEKKIVKMYERFPKNRVIENWSGWGHNNDFLKDEEYKKFEKEVEELDFEKAKSIEEEISLIEEMEKSSIDYDENRYPLI